jgi:AcrR family transcriptional regulator
MSLFREYGYQATKLDDVARSLGITKAAVYYYFPTKADLLIESCGAVVDVGLEQIRELEGNVGLTASERLERFFAQHLTALAENVEAWTVFFEDVRISQEMRAKSLRATQRKFGECLERIVADGMRTGEFRAMDSELVTNGILGMCNWAYRWIERDHAPTENVIKTFSTLILGGLVPGDEQ